MSFKVKKVEEKKPKVPAYIVTFSDMITLLLTFFVMLLSLAKMQDPALLDMGRESFNQSLRYLGLGMFFGQPDRPEFGHAKLRRFIENPDARIRGRTIDAKEDNIRIAFKSLSQSMAAIPSQIVSKKTNFSPTNIRFEPGKSELNSSAKEFLAEFCQDLMQDPESSRIKLYILGMANEDQPEKQQWLVSAKRAQKAADFMRKSCGSRVNWTVYWWGAGPGGNWVTEDSPISEDTQILIAVLRAKG